MLEMKIHKDWNKKYEEFYWYILVSVASSVLS